MMIRKFIAMLAIALSVATPILAQERTFVTNPPTTSGSGLSYNSGTDTVTATAADGARIYTVTRPIERGAKYKYEFTVSDYSAGGIQPYVGTTRDTSVAPVIPATVTPATNQLVSGRTPIADNFTTADGLTTGEVGQFSGDPVGAYRMWCKTSHVGSMDPLVRPGLPGASHMHNFFGNNGTNAYSTYETLRRSGGTSCAGDQAHPIWRSAYWFPAMLDGKGGIVTAGAINVYYKRAAVTHPQCTQTDPGGTGICIRFPFGLNMITGYDMTSMTNTNPATWACEYRPTASTAGASLTGPTVTYASLQALRDNGGCPIGNAVRISVDFPSCWDGINVQTANHRDHVFKAPGGSNFHGTCPVTHPYHFPHISIQIYIDADENLNTWRLSSDDQMGMGVVAGQTFHTDFMMAVGPDFMDQWEDGCIDAWKSCSNGVNGTGQMMKNNTNFLTPSRRIPMTRQGLGLIRRKNGTFRGEFTAPDTGEFGLYALLFTGKVSNLKVTKISKGATGPVTQPVTQ